MRVKVISLLQLNLGYVFAYQYFCGALNTKNCIFMKEKMAKFLKELYSNLGLPQSVLDSVAAMAVIGLSDDSTDEAIKSRAEEESVKSMLKSFQAHADKRATDARKEVEEKNKGEKKEEPKKEEPKNEDKPAWLQELLDAQKAQTDALTKRLESLENANTAKSFAEKVASIGKEFKLEGAVLDLCKQGLSADADEGAIRDHLGKAAKTLSDLGAAIGGKGTEEHSSTEAQEKQWQQDELAWAKREAAKQAAQAAQERANY